MIDLLTRLRILLLSATEEDRRTIRDGLESFFYSGLCGGLIVGLTIAAILNHLGVTL
jgi:hypothetical protein